MLEITARLFKDNQLVGYRITDGQQEQDFNKMQTWMFAKQNQIANVKVIGNGDNGEYGLSGTNGFELKSLPQVKWEESTNKSDPDEYDTLDLLAGMVYTQKLDISRPLSEIASDAKELAIISTMQDTKARNQRMREFQKNNFKKMLAEPNFNERRRSLSNRLEVTHTIVVGDKLVGYTITNVSASALLFVRRKLSKLALNEADYLRPGESMDISRMEMILTLALPEYSGKFSNGKLIMSNIKNLIHIDKWILNSYICCNNKIEKKQLEINENSVKYIVNNKTMEAIVKMSKQDSAYISRLADQYAEDGVDASDMVDKINELHQNNLRTQKEVKQKLRESKGIKGIFNAFKS